MSLRDTLQHHVDAGALPGAVAVVAGPGAGGRGRRLGRRRGQPADGRGLPLPDRLPHQADHRRRGPGPGGRRPARPRRPDRPVAARAGGPEGRAHPGGPGRRPRAGEAADHRVRPADQPGRLGVRVRLLAPGGAGAVPRPARRPGGAALPRARRLGRPAGRGAAGLPAGRILALRHVFGGAGRARRPGVRTVAARVPRRADPRAAGHGRHRVRGRRRPARPVHQLLQDRPTGWSSPTRRTASGARCRRCRSARAAWPGRWATGSPSAGCCSPRGRPRRPARAHPRVGPADDHRPHHRGAARDRRAVPGGPGLGVGRLGRHRRRRPVERPRPLRLGRRHRHLRPRRPLHRHGRLLLTQVGADSPVPPEWMRDFWQ